MKTKVLVEVTISCEPPAYPYWRGWTQEEYAKHCEEWVKDFHDFIRDHRSQDPVMLNVEKKYEEHCSFCDTEWEWKDDEEPGCCDEAVAEWQEQHKGAA